MGKITKREGRIFRKNRKKERRLEENRVEAEKKAPGKADYLLKYHQAAEERHPELFKDKDSSFCKKFYNAATKGAAKRALRDKLREIAGII